jgi:hypothetical protein
VPENFLAETDILNLFQFGPDVTQNFLNTNGMDYIVRSHEVKDEGYELAHDGKCITVFSAPNYCDSMGNKVTDLMSLHFGKFLLTNLTKNTTDVNTAYKCKLSPKYHKLKYGAAVECHPTECHLRQNVT